MWFWAIILAFDLIIPFVMTIGGLLMWKKTPKNISSVIGYRTSSSKKNLDTWNTANRYSGKLFFRWGIVLLLLSFLAHLLLIHSSDNVISLSSVIIAFVQIIPFILIIISTENLMKKTFDDNGNRKQ